MRLKKWMCFLLVSLMLVALSACGEDAGHQGGDGNQTKPNGGKVSSSTTISPTQPSTQPSVEELGPWVVTEEVDYMGYIRRYQYDENGELTSYELFDKDNVKYRDYKATHLETDNGGKLTEVQTKHVKESTFTKDCEMEYDAAGNLIRLTNFLNGRITGNYLYQYDAEGNLTSYEGHVEGSKSGEATYTYVDRVLATATGTVIRGDVSYTYNYTYTYSEDGYLSEIHFNRPDVGEGTITLGKYFSLSEGGLHVLTHSAHSMAYQNLYGYETQRDADGQRNKFTIIFNRWGFVPFYAIPLPAYGSMLTSWEENVGQITYTRLDVYLAQQST